MELSTTGEKAANIPGESFDREIFYFFGLNGLTLCAGTPNPLNRRSNVSFF
ncbi:MAG: hypothetical protein WBB29_08530 [Geitlerinemataceae cyanobacterium]